MKRIFTALLLLLPAIAFAQTAEVIQKIDAKLQVERDAQRQEDVEILRRLLNRGFGLPNEVKIQSPLSAYSQGTGSFSNPEFKMDSKILTSAPTGLFDALSLPEIGLIYTLHIPSNAELTFHDASKSVGLDSSCKACHTVGTGSTHTHNSTTSDCSKCHASNTLLADAKPATDWDKLKAEIRGEKPVEKAKPKADRATLCEYGRIENAAISLLFANAKNVRQLGPKESIRIAVTLDHIPSSAAEKKGQLDPDKTGASTSKPGLTPKESQLLTLADLGMKAGKYSQAVDAYSQALARFAKEKTYRIDSLGQIAPDQRVKLTEEFQKEIRDAMASFAKALMLNNEIESAKQALALATEFVVLEVSPTKSTPSPIGPAKLIVTVTKADLDAAKTFAELKKAAKVERVNWVK